MKKALVINALMILSLLVGLGQNTVSALDTTSSSDFTTTSSQVNTATAINKCISISGTSALFGTNYSSWWYTGGSLAAGSYKLPSPDYSNTISLQSPLDSSSYVGTTDLSATVSPILVTSGTTSGSSYIPKSPDYSSTISLQQPTVNSFDINSLNTSDATLAIAHNPYQSVFTTQTDAGVFYRDVTTKPLSSTGYVVPISSSTNLCNQVSAPVLPTPTVDLTVNGSGVAYVTYDGSATLDWESTGMESCNLTLIGQSGTTGHYVQQDVTSNMTVTINCTIAPGYANIQLTPPTVTIKVLPPTYDYLNTYLAQLQTANTDKKLNFASATQLVEQSKKANDSGKLELAQAFLQQSINDIKKPLYAKQLTQAAITKYEAATSYLSKTLPVKVELASDGCSVTAKGPAGLTLEYGANYQMKKSFGQQVVIPESGTITVPTYAPKGYSATGEVTDSTGLIYGRSTKDVTTAECPPAPVYQDSAQHFGYPDKWALPAPGTILDDWGFYNRTPESYIAFRLAESGRSWPVGYGDASGWLEKATLEGYVVSTPRPGDIAINTDPNNTTFSTAEYVERAEADGGMQTTSISPSGDFWGAGTSGGGWYNMKYIRFP